MSDVHRNSHKNQKAHHLYAIKDKEDKDKKVVVKFGISSDEIEEDGLSDRIRRQLKLFNAVVG